MTKSIQYQGYLIETLKDPEEAAGYLNAALGGGNVSVFLLALQNVVQAQGGITKLAIETHKSRTSLYNALSEKGNPYLKGCCNPNLYGTNFVKNCLNILIYFSKLRFCDTFRLVIAYLNSDCNSPLKSTNDVLGAIGMQFAVVQNKNSSQRLHS